MGSRPSSSTWQSRGCAAVAGVVVEAARQADCDLHLALVSVAESGIAEYAGGGYRDDPEERFEVGEVTDVLQTVAEWRHPDGSRPPLGALPFFSDELAPPDAFDGLEPDELDFQEATGNEGASFDRLYQRAALVLWPRAHRTAVLAQGGLGVTVPFLGELARQWQAGGEGREAPLWQEAHELAVQIQGDWPATAWERRRASEGGYAAAFLGHLVALGDREVIEAFAAGPMATGAYGPRDNEALVAALAQMPPARSAERLTAILTHNAPDQPAACADVLARSVAVSADAASLLRPAGLALLGALPVAPPDQPVSIGGGPREAPTASMVVALLGALARIDPSLAERGLAHLLAHRAAYEMDRVLGPAALELYAAPETRALPSVQVLRTAVLVHLRRRVAEPLEPPADWRRPSAIACTCAHCRELARFLDDPTRASWTFKAAEADRRHVEASIERSRCDLEWVTEKRGRPYGLVCTKNQASYQRRVRQRQQDLASLAALDAEMGAPPSAPA